MTRLLNFDLSTKKKIADVTFRYFPWQKVLLLLIGALLCLNIAGFVVNMKYGPKQSDLELVIKTTNPVVPPHPGNVSANQNKCPLQWQNINGLSPNCTCRTILIQERGCSLVCPVPLTVAANPDGIQMPTQFWRFLASSVMFPHIFHTQQPVCRYLWLPPVNTAMFIINNLAFPFVMMDGIGFFYWGVAFSFIGQLVFDVILFGVNVCRNDSASLHHFLNHGGLPQSAAQGIFAGLLALFAVKIAVLLTAAFGVAFINRAAVARHTASQKLTSAARKPLLIYLGKVEPRNAPEYQV